MFARFAKVHVSPPPVMEFTVTLGETTESDEINARRSSLAATVEKVGLTMVVLFVLLSLKTVTSIVGAGALVLFTVILTGAEVAKFPPVSLARAESICVPFVTLKVLQLRL
jgi:hypothetical protein